MNNITEHQYKQGGTPPYVPAAGYQAPSNAAEPAVSPYQGVAIRFVALLIDAIILAIMTAVITLPLQMPVISVIDLTNVSTVTASPNPLAWLGGLISVLIIFGYFILLEGSYGQTVGKLAVKIKVTREDGSKISYADAVVRNVLRIIDGIIVYLIGAILIWSSDEKQRLGDRVAHTVVVKA